MKLKHVAFAISLSALASSSYAAGFTGFGMDFQVQFKNTGGDSVKTRGYSDIEYTDTSSLSGEHDIIGAVGMNYGFALAKRWILQVGVEADLMKSDAHNMLDSVRVGTYSAQEFESLEQKQHYSIHLQPGYLLHAGTMIYAKLSYHQMKLDGTNGNRVTDVGVSDVTALPIGASFKGFGVGFGVQTLVARNVYAFAEVNHVRYGSEVLGVPTDPAAEGEWTAKPRTTSGSIGIGWRF